MSMTKEEAIAFLSRYVDNEYYTPQCQEAHRMAIEALRERDRVTMGDREKLVELIEQSLCDHISFSCKLAENIANDLIANGVTFATDNNVGGRWIPVTERLPEKSGVYIVTACDEGCSCGEGIWYGTVVVVAEYYKGSWAWDENGTEYDLSGIVTHWMPLPEPPKEGE